MAERRFDDPAPDDPATAVDGTGGEDETADAVGVGDRLRAVREAQGLAQDELAQALNLPVRVVRALEEDDDAQLPGATFVRGYIRSWARLAGEPAEPLLAAYEARAGRPRPMVEPTPWLEPVSTGTRVLHHRPGLVMIVVTLILVAAGALVLFGIGPDALERSAAAPGSASAPAIESDRAAPEPSPTAPPPDRPADGEAAGDDPSAAEVPVAEVPVAEPSPGEAPVAEVPVAEAPVTEDPVAADVVIERSADGSGTRVLAGGESRLRLAFSDECWVEIRDRTDRVVHRDLHREGQVLALLGPAPFRVRLGYAPAVDLSYNDSRVPLAPHTRNDVASLVIGR